jgi:hypothetical protein
MPPGTAPYVPRVPSTARRWRRERGRGAVGYVLDRRPEKIMELSGFVEEKVDGDPPEFPLSPDLPRSFRNLVHFLSRSYHPPLLHRATGPAWPEPGDQRRTVASMTNRRAR